MLTSLKQSPMSWVRLLNPGSSNVRNTEDDEKIKLDIDDPTERRAVALVFSFFRFLLHFCYFAPIRPIFPRFVLIQYWFCSADLVNRSSQTRTARTQDSNECNKTYTNLTSLTFRRRLALSNSTNGAINKLCQLDFWFFSSSPRQYQIRAILPPLVRFWPTPWQ